MRNRAGRSTTTPPVGDQSRLPRLIVCTVANSRSKATVPASLMLKRERTKWEAFFRDLLHLRPGQRVEIREVYE